MPESSINHPLFGLVRFRTASSQWVRGDKIVFLSGFDSRDITPITVPQLRNIPGSHGGVLSFHRRGHAQLLQAFDEIESQGLLSHIESPRFS